MLEVIAVIGLYRFLKKRLIRKNRSESWAVLGPVLLVFGELLGLILSGSFLDDNGPILYALGLLGALIGSLISLAIVAVISSGPLHCPACDAAFVPTSEKLISNAKCQGCAAELRVIKGKVKLAKAKKSGREGGLKLTAQAGPNRCPYCHADVSVSESVACTGCLARHHEECWDSHKECASCAGRTRFSAVEETEGRKPKGEGKGRVKSG